MSVPEAKMLGKVELFLARVDARFAELWLTYWQRHGDDEAFSRPHWC